MAGTAGEIGTNTSLSTPHTYDLATGLTPGKHTLTIRVDNRRIVSVGAWADSVTHHTQGNWNGISSATSAYARLRPVWIEDLQAFPNVARQLALGRVRLGNATGKAGHATSTIGRQSQPVDWDEQARR